MKNSQLGYGIITIVLHAVGVVGVVALYILGLYNNMLDYYDPLYKTIPDLHKSIGVILVSVFVFRILWKGVNVAPKPLPSHAKWEHITARCVHWVLLLLVLAMLPTGYFITTAKGAPLVVFNIFEIPAVITHVDGLSSTAMAVHSFLAHTIIAIASLHALAALKHQFIDRDSTLLRILVPHSHKKNLE